MATGLERWLGYVLLQSSAMPGISPSCRVYFSFCLTGRVPFALFQWKRLRGKLSFPDNTLSFLLHAPPYPCQTGWTGYLPKIHPNFQSTVQLTWSNSCLPSAPPCAGTQTLMDSQEGGHPGWSEVCMAQRQAVCHQEHLGRAREMFLSEAWASSRAGGSTAPLQACAFSMGSPFRLSIMLLLYTHSFHQHHERLRTHCQKKMGAGNFCSSKSELYPFRMGLVPLTGRRWFLYAGVGENWFKLKQGGHGDQRHAAPLYLLLSHWGLVRTLLCPHPWKPLSPAPKPPQGQDCSTLGFEALDTQIHKSHFCHTTSVLIYSTDVERNWVIFWECVSK